MSRICGAAAPTLTVRHQYCRRTADRGQSLLNDWPLG